MERPLTRRQLLALAGATSTAMAGCLGIGADSGQPSPESTNDESLTADGTEDGTPSTDESNSGTDASSPDSVTLPETWAVSGRDWPARRFDAGNTGSITGMSGPETKPSVSKRTPEVLADNVCVVDGIQYNVAEGPVVVASRLNDGSEVWHKTIGEDEGAGPITTSDVVATDSILVFGDGSTLYALERSDGSVRWQVETGEVAAPTVADGTVVVESGSESQQPTIHAIDATSGDTSWTKSVEKSYPARVAVADGNVYHTTRGSVVARSLGDGTERWRYDAGSVVPVAATPSHVFVPSVASALYALNPKTGKEFWVAERTAETPSSYSSEGLSPAVTEERVFVRQLDGTLRAYDSGTGDQLWKIELRFEESSYAPSNPVVAGDTVYVCGWHGVAAFDATDGTERWQVNEGILNHAGSPGVFQNRLVSHSANYQYIVE